MKLSICMIAKDEEKHIRNCLESVHGLVDEMIVVDTGSKDRTKGIAEGMGAKVISHPWNDDFSDARNVSLEHATGDWILVLDADETVSKKDHERLRELISKEGVEGYALIQRNYMDYRESHFVLNDNSYEEGNNFRGWHPSPIVRLFRNRKQYRFRYLVHELVDPSIQENKGRIELADIPIHHFGAQKSRQIRSRKNEKYADLLRRQVEATPDYFDPVFKLGNVYLDRGEYDKALDLYERANKLKPEFPPIVMNLCFLYSKLSRNEDAKRLLEKTKRKFPAHVDLLNMLGAFELQEGDVDAAVSTLRRSLEISQANPNAWADLGVACVRRLQLDDAMTFFKRSIELSPKRPQTHFNLACVYDHLGRKDDATREYEAELKITHDHGKAKAQLAALKK